VYQENGKRKRVLIDNSKEYILCAAWKRKEPRQVEGEPYRVDNDILNIEIGYRHHDIYLRFNDELVQEQSAMGFYTSRGRFVSREEGMEIAIKCGQVIRSKPKWTKEDTEDTWLPVDKKHIGKYKPLISEDLYCCSPDGNTMSE